MQGVPCKTPLAAPPDMHNAHPAPLRLLAHQEHVAAGLGRAAFGFERDGERVGYGRGGFGKLLDHEEKVACGLFKVEDPG